MTPRSLLPHETATLVDAELRPGEHITWVGQPNPGRFARQTLGLVLFGLPWTAFAIFWIVSASSSLSSTSLEREPFGFFHLFRFVFPLFGLPFVLIGFAMLSSPCWMRRKALRTAYVITDQRAIVFDASGWKGTTIRSFEPDRLRDLSRVENGDGSGDLVFERERKTTRKGREHSIDIGFLAVPNVKQVEETIRALIARTNTSHAS